MPLARTFTSSGSRRGDLRLLRGTPRFLILSLIPGVLAACDAASTPASFDVLLSDATIFDGSGGARYQADIGVRDGFIVEIGELSGAPADVVLEVEGLYVTPGFINMHGHPTPSVLSRAENTLRQGITTEFLYPDGGGPMRPWEEIEALEDDGLAVNIGAWVGFGTIWGEVVGLQDRRPTPEETERMRQHLDEALERGAWGVTTNLDAAPQSYATTDEIVAVLQVAEGRRAAYQSHLRSEGAAVIEALAEAIEIGERTGLVPLWTHAKAEGPPNWGKSAEAVELLDATLARGTYVAGDVYPYLAGQSSIARRFIPRWAADGGFQAMLQRFEDPGLRPRIGEEAEALLEERVGGAPNILLRAGAYMNRYLDEVADEMGVRAGEAVIRVVEEHGEDVRMNYWFGDEADLVRILEHPNIAAGCDCGATDSENIHPRNYGSFPRFLGEYARDRQLLSYEEMIRKMTGLPATQMGLADRGFIAEGMVADLVAFDPQAVTDHATFEAPKQYPEGIEYVLVNGRVALAGGELTGAQAGRALRRSPHLPSRPMGVGTAISLGGEGAIEAEGTHAGRISFSVRAEGQNLRGHRGTFLFEGTDGTRLEALRIGQVQATEGWATFSGSGVLSGPPSLASTDARGAVPFLIIVEGPHVSNPEHGPTVTIRVRGKILARGVLSM